MMPFLIVKVYDSNYDLTNILQYNNLNIYFCLNNEER
jgi:hypothetical protein